MKSLTFLRSVLLSFGAVVAVSASAQVIGGGGGPGTQEPSLPDFGRFMVDYQDNIPATDAAWGGNPHPGIEFYSPDEGGGWSVNNIVYKRGTTIHGQTTIKNWNMRTVNLTLEILPGNLRSEAPNNLQQMGIPYENRALSVSASPTSGSLGYLGTLTFTWSVSGVPAYDCAGFLTCPVKYHLVFADQPTYHMTNTDDLAGVNVAIVDAQSTDSMTRPWADFAYHGGLWAWGASGEDDFKQKLVYGFHYSNRHAFERVCYDYSTPRYYDAPHSRIKMSQFLYDLTHNMWTYLDCQDFSAFTAYAFDANGYATSQRRMSNTGYNQTTGQIYSTGFNTNPLCPAGYDSTMLSNYKPWGFSFHMLASPKSGGTFSPKTYDSSSSYAVDLSSNWYMNPVAGWQVPGYWNTAVGSKVSGGVEYGMYAGLCSEFLYGLWTMAPNTADYKFSTIY